MVRLPKPRGFWDYALFALVMTGVMVLLFRSEASDGLGWADAALALAAAVLLVLGIVLARRGEKATWIVRPTWHAYLLATLGVSVLTFGAIYADAYLLHRRDLTFNRLLHDLVLVIIVTAATLWSSRRRSRARREVL